MKEASGEGEIAQSSMKNVFCVYSNADCDTAPIAASLSLEYWRKLHFCIKIAKCIPDNSRFSGPWVHSPWVPGFGVYKVPKIMGTASQGPTQNHRRNTA